MATNTRVPLTLALDALDAELHIEHATLTQGLSEGFKFVARVRHHRGDIMLGALPGWRVRIVFDEDPTQPPLIGVLTEAKYLSRSEAGHEYLFVVEPRTAFMRLRRDHRIFKDCNAVDLGARLVEPLAARVGDVLAVGNLASLPTHEYRVQYGESDWGALTRLLAEDGVTFFYDHTREGALTLCADTRSLECGRRVVRYVMAASLVPSGTPIVTRVATKSTDSIRRVRVGDDWMDKPDFDASAEVGRVPTADPLEHYVFDLGVENTMPELQRQAELHLLEHVVPANRMEVDTNTFFTPGMELQIENSPIRSATAPMRVVTVVSEWSTSPAGATAMHRLECVRKDQQWVPPRQAKPRIAGVQRAIVVGDGEIDVDEFGRIVCAFDWDRARTQSRRVEVSQAWAGAGYGHTAHPRVGDEVLVAYLDGDPDEPVVVGRVHNGRNKHAWNPKEHKELSVWHSRSTPNAEGYNEIGMKDLAGSELLWMHAQRDLESYVERDATGWCGRDFTMNVGRHTNVKVVGTTNMLCEAPATWHGVDLEVDASGMFKLTCGTRLEKVAATYALTIGGDYVVNALCNETHSVAGQMLVSASTFMVSAGGAVLMMNSAGIFLGFGGSSITMKAGVITLVSPLIELNP